MKSFISLVVALGILITGAIFECNFVEKQFDEFKYTVTELEKKCDGETLTKDDVITAKKDWYDKKEYLHIFIPHNEIKEIDLWLNEAVTYAEQKDYMECKAKFVVVKELLTVIPKTFTLRIENIL